MDESEEEEFLRSQENLKNHDGLLSKKSLENVAINFQISKMFTTIANVVSLSYHTQIATICTKVLLPTSIQPANKYWYNQYTGC